VIKEELFNGMQLNILYQKLHMEVELLMIGIEDF